MKWIAGLLLLLLTGCTSLQYGGVSSYKVKPIETKDGIVCCEVDITNGKEIDSVELFVEKKGDNYTIGLSQKGVKAFEGQEAIAKLTGEAATAAIKAGTAVLIAPAAAQLGGAAIGAIAK